MTIKEEAEKYGREHGPDIDFPDNLLDERSLERAYECGAKGESVSNLVSALEILVRSEFIGVDDQETARHALEAWKEANK